MQKVEVLASTISVPQLSKLSLSTSKIITGTDKVKISFYADRACNVYCRVYDNNNKLVATVSNGGQLSKASTWSLSWSGSDGNGKYLSPGTYKIQVFLKDQNGTSKALYANIELIAQSTDKIVKFADKTLEFCIRSEINKDTGDIFLSDVQKITKLDLNYTYEGHDVIKNLSGLEYLSNLTYLNLGENREENKVTSLAPLKNLKNLRELYIDFNQTSNIDALSGLTNLKVLHLGGNKITSVEALRNLTNLEYLYVGVEYIDGGNNVTDISPLIGLTNLKELGLYGNNNITNIDALKGMTKLTLLNLRGPHINSIAALSGMKNMRNLYVGTSNSKIADISVLKNMTELRELDLAGNKITTIEPLRYLTKLETLSIAGNNIRKLEPLSGLININNLSIGTSCAGGNPVTDFSVLKNFKKLDTLFLDLMNLKKIDFLAGYTNLKCLDLKNNEITSIEPLRGLIKLKYLYLGNNKITDFSPIDDILKNLTDTDVNQ